MCLEEESVAAAILSLWGVVAPGGRKRNPVGFAAALRAVLDLDGSACCDANL